MADTVRTQQELLDRMKINVAGVQVGRRADINVQTFRDFVVSIPTLGAPGLSNIVEDLTPQLGGNLDMNTFDMCASVATGPCVLDEASNVNAVIVPNQAQIDQGLGYDTALSGPALHHGGVNKFVWTSAGLLAKVATGPMLVNAAASPTNPTLLPDRSDLTKGVGSGSGNSLSLISASTEVLRLAGVGGGVNSYTFSSAVAGLPGRMIAQGPDTNIDTYLASKGIGVIGFHPGNAGRELFIDTDGLKGEISTGPAFLNEAASATNPTLVPDRTVPTSGIGKSGASLDLIIAGLSRLRVGTGVGNPNTVLQPVGSSGLFLGSVSGSFGLHNVAASALVPTLLPNFLNETTGIGSVSAGIGNLISNGNSVMSWNDIAGALFQTLVAGQTAGSWLLQNSASSPTVPTLIPNKTALTTGIGGASGNIALIIGGLRMFFVSGNALAANDGNGAALEDRASTATVATLVPNRNNTTSGVGGVSGSVSLIGANTEQVTVNSTGIGFFATTPAAQPTGVAVTAAAIHAALVTLGLITA